MKTIVLGIGNPILTDDGVSIHIVKRLYKTKLDADIKLAATGGLGIIEIVAGYDRLILVDAIITGNEPGTIFELSLDELQTHPPVHFASTHDVSFIAALKLGRELMPEKMPSEIIIFAIEVEDITTFGEECTPKVQKAIPQVIKLIKEKILDFQVKKSM